MCYVINQLLPHTYNSVPQCSLAPRLGNRFISPWQELGTSPQPGTSTRLLCGGRTRKGHHRAVPQPPGDQLHYQRTNVALCLFPFSLPLRWCLPREPVPWVRDQNRAEIYPAFAGQPAGSSSPCIRWIQHNPAPEAHCWVLAHWQG